MNTKFIINYHTFIGQTIAVEFQDEMSVYNELSYKGYDIWEGEVDITKHIKDNKINYRYVVLDSNNKSLIREEGRFGNQFHESIVYEAKKLEYRDTFISGTEPEDSFLTTTFFKQVQYGERVEEKLNVEGQEGAVIKVRCTCVEKGKALYLAGGNDETGNWSIKGAIEMKPVEFPFWSVYIKDVSKPFEYKYFIANKNDRSYVQWEQRSNRVFIPVEKETLRIQEDSQYTGNYWRGAGVVSPVFSLRTNNGCGVGEFTDIKLLVDWCKKCGFSMIQTLPINDTTSYYNWMDSYPYLTASVQALHPLYLHLDSLTTDSKILEEIAVARKRMNAYKFVDYEEVMAEKDRIARECFKTFKKDDAYEQWFEKSKHWLMPFAVFRTLHKAKKLPESPKNFEIIEQLYKENKEECDYLMYVQYNLHLQLLDAANYAKANKVCLKGDLPIGVSRDSVECWMYPHLFRLNKSTGAPPDYFSAGEGQNWGFPTYDWDNMDKEDYKWWQSRLTHMSQYFQAYRIDHILGFFRIWEIPAIHRTGLLGRFKPDIPMSRQKLTEYGIYDTDRLTYPYIREHTLDALFKDEKEFVKNKFLQGGNGVYSLKPEYSSEGQILEQTGLSPKERPADAMIIKGLKTLLQNVCLMTDENNKDLFYPRIDMEKSYSSFNELDYSTQNGLRRLYNDYFYKTHEGLWEYTARRRLPALLKASDMLVCGEDLGMVPDCVVRVMDDLKIACLRIQRLTDKPTTVFYHPNDYQYLTVCAPSGHDMSTIRGWWMEEREKVQYFWNNLLLKQGKAPETCPEWAIKSIIDMHMYSPAMLACFPLQDVMAQKPEFNKGTIPSEQQINRPENVRHYWRYRCHITLEQLIETEDLNTHMTGLIKDSGRYHF